MDVDYDYLIVGAGFSGLVMAERLTTQLNAKVLVVDKRDHAGGNAQDAYNAHGVLIHQYGPHYFRTNSSKIVDYLSQFTKWHSVDYKILSYTEDRYWNFPVNLNTFEQLIGRESTSEEFEAWLEKERVEIKEPKNSEEVITSQIGWQLYEKFFKGYTLKQWQKDPKELDKSVCGRIPIRTNRDDRYLRESFQALPKDGYHALFANIIKACGEQLTLQLNADFQDAKKSATYKHLIYTGPIDTYFDYCHGKLPYRSLRFEEESFTPEQLKERQAVAKKENHWQPAMQVNYPNENDYTRIVEIKHATGQKIDNTTIVKEYPQAFTGSNEPYYPIPTKDSKALYQKYKALADAEENTTFIGRLATYKYYNMDQVVGAALTAFEHLRKAQQPH